MVTYAKLIKANEKPSELVDYYIAQINRRHKIHADFTKNFENGKD